MASDDLRTRIAAALCGDYCVQGMTAPCDDCRAHSLRQADAVIREIGLKRASRPSDYGHVNYPPGYQYITDWIADE